MIKLVFLLTFLTTIFSGNHFSLINHALYLSVMEIDHRELTRETKINIKVFESDIEDALKNKFKTPFNFDDQDICAKKKEEILSYFTEHLFIEINGIKTPLIFDSCEKNDNSIWFYFRINTSGKWNEVNIKANYLMELFPTQSNVISIYNGDARKFLRVTRDNSTRKVSF